MIVAGGVYVERCMFPDTTRLLGSGGRASLALSSFRQDIVLHTFHPPELWRDLDANFCPYGIGCHPYASDERITFSYLFPLARPEQSPEAISSRREQVVSGRDALSFGCIEGDFVMQCDAAVFDPQGSGARGFREAGSQANRLAIVLNRSELMGMTGQSAIGEAAAHLLMAERADTIVVKDGPSGAIVCRASAAPQIIPAYGSSALCKIGSGDIFSAVFAHEWLAGRGPCDAADLASRHTAVYVESATLPLRRQLPNLVPRRIMPINHVVLVGEAGFLAKAALLTILRDSLHRLGIPFVEIVDISDYGRLRGRLGNCSSVLFCVEDEETSRRLLSLDDIESERCVIYAESSVLPCLKERDGLRLFCDISLALYEIFWMPV